LKSEQVELTQKEIFKFWLPIAATWLMMAIEGPFLAAVIARLPDIEFNLGAFGIAFSFGLLVEAPIMMLVSAAVALVRDRSAFLKLLRFTWILNGSVTLLMLVICIPGIFSYISIELMGLPGDLAFLAHRATILLIPWPAAIGFRRFYQGILIRSNRTRRVAWGTVVRLLSMSITTFLLVQFTELPGAWLGCIALSTGVTIEAIATWIMTRETINQLACIDSVNALTYKRIWSFYYPLALSSMMALGIRPVINFFVARCSNPIESLAVLPVVTSASFLFICYGLSFQEVALALMGNRFQQIKPVKKFAFTMIIVLSAGSFLVAFSFLGKFWFSGITDLTTELLEFTTVPYRLAVILPAMAVVLSLLRAILVNAGKNKPISWATGIEVCSVITAMYIFSVSDVVSGITASFLALIVGRVVSIAYLYRSCYKDCILAG